MPNRNITSAVHSRKLTHPQKMGPIALVACHRQIKHLIFPASTATVISSIYYTSSLSDPSLNKTAQWKQVSFEPSNEGLTVIENNCRLVINDLSLGQASHRDESNVSLFLGTMSTFLNCVITMLFPLY